MTGGIKATVGRKQKGRGGADKSRDFNQSGYAAKIDRACSTAGRFEKVRLVAHGGSRMR